MSGNRVHTADEFGGLQAWWSSIPPVTRFFGSIWGATAIAFELALYPARSLCLDRWSILKNFQIWRLVTNVTFLTRLSPKFLFGILWWFIYAPPIERTSTEYSPGEFAFCVTFCVLCLNIIGLLDPRPMLLFSSERLVFAVLYLWSRDYSNQDVSIYGMIQIKGFYLPWVYAAIGIVAGGGMHSLIEDLIGILVGHLYYFLKSIYPAQTGNQILKCPSWLHRSMAKFYKQGTTQPNEGTGTQANRFRAFQGRGRRLQD